MSGSPFTAKLESGELRINLYDFLGKATGEERAALIDALACQSEVIDEVMNQVLDGYTSLGSHGPTGMRGNAEATHGIDGARMRIAKMASEVAAKEIEGMHTRIKMAEELAQKGWDAYHDAIGSRRYA